MNKEWAEKWAAALRSGEYKQGTGRLRQGDSFCCLGVLCDLVSKTNWRDGVGWGVDACSIHTCYLPKAVRGLVQGLSDGQGTLPLPNQESLMELNDKGTSFPAIADLIDKHWEVL